MERQVAESLAAEFKTLHDALNNLSETSLEISNEAERHAFRRDLAGIMAAIDDQVVRFVSRQFPDLDPIEPVTRRDES